MKNFLLLGFLFLSSIAFAQDDSVKTKNVTVNTAFTLASKNVWRGVNYGNNLPTLQGTLALVVKEKFEIGACGTTTINGDKRGFGNWMELYTSYTINRWSFTIDDYYFFSYDSLNDYFNWDSKTTQHLIEGRVKYNIDKKFNIMASYNFYANKDAQKAFYFEAEYFIKPDFSFTVGAVTGPSWLNYYDKGGITTIGINGYRDLKVSKKIKIPLKSSLYFNPNYKNIAKWDGSGYVDPGYNYLGRNPVNFIISLNF